MPIQPLWAHSFKGTKDHLFITLPLREGGAKPKILSLTVIPAFAEIQYIPIAILRVSFYPVRMKKPLFSSALLGAACCILMTSPAHAAPESLGKYGYWSTYKMMEGQNPVCYMSITAKAPAAKQTKDKKQKAIRRGDVVLMITHRPAEGATDVISYAAGTKFRPASDVAFKMGDRSFSLFTQGDTAWARDQATDKAVAAALRSSSTVTVTGIAANESSIADTVNLKGMAEAYYAIGKACGLDVQPPPKPVQKKGKSVKPSTVKADKAPEKPKTPEKPKVQ